MEFFLSTKIPRGLKYVAELQMMLDNLSQDTVNDITVYILKSDLVSSPDKVRTLAHELLTYNVIYTKQKQELIILIMTLLQNQIPSNELHRLKMAILEECCLSDSNLDNEISKILLLRKLFLAGMINYKEMETILELVARTTGNSPEKFFVFFLSIAPEMHQRHLSLYNDMVQVLTNKTQFSQHLKLITKNLAQYEEENFKKLRELMLYGQEPNSLQYIIYNDDVESLKGYISKNPKLETLFWISPLDYSENPDINMISMAALYGSYNCFMLLAEKCLDILKLEAVLWGENLKILEYVLYKKNHEFFHDSLRNIGRFRCLKSIVYLLKNNQYTELELNKAFVSAVYYQNYHLIFKLIELGADINYRNPETGMTAFAIACKESHFSLLNTLIIRKTVDVNTKDLNGETPLIKSVKNCNSRVTKILLECDRVDLNAKDDNGYTALLYACRNASLYDVKLLMSKGEKINPNLKSKKGDFPLKFAVISGNEEIIDKLLEHPNIDVNNRDDEGCTALFHAARLSKSSTILQIMEQSEKADPNLSGSNGFSPLIISVLSGNVDCVKTLLSYERTDVNHKDGNGNTALIAACGIKNYEMAKLILAQKNLNINARGKLGNTALMTASMRGCKDIVELICNYQGVNVNLRNDNDNTPLHEAIRFKHKEVVLYLMKLKDIALNTPNKSGETPVAVAASSGDVEIMANLLTLRGIDANYTNGVNPTPLAIAIKAGNINLVRMMVLSPYVDVNMPSPPDSFSPAFIAASEGKSQILEAILRSPGIRSDLKPGNGAKFLFDAAEGNKEVIAVLERNGLSNS
ncbi:hypothetical protein TVAG_487730 [Trichomonas vaginalis G3]|uniref:Uncharacterized protein n=2 Tax=Trichomonas vaginalis (strain ATCC PRA-98 / G3) TaxID=412133 RepID=A2EFQ1_TRIV3|nr:spectrin binding [Trichomonas vaginalis G3]EAY08546.1 hypothetical protein TVAG_487730 [Trichomonas vaginalis G3]KAI5542122.1 spectrin binding [Trichomonas vaginalis G3]|eukprot:XP_001320769.1 hypothetical protein [Trichomonas vaginalis G3]